MSDSTTDLKTIHSRDINIKDDQFGVSICDGLDGNVTILGCNDVIAVLLQNL